MTLAWENRSVIEEIEFPLPAVNSVLTTAEKLKEQFLSRWDVKFLNGRTRRYIATSFFIRVTNKGVGEHCSFDYPIEDFRHPRRVAKISDELYGITLMTEQQFRILRSIISDFEAHPEFAVEGEMNDFIVAHESNIDTAKIISRLLEYINESGQLVDYCNKETITNETIAVRLTSATDIATYGENTYIIKGDIFKEVFGTTDKNVIGSTHAVMHREGYHIRKAASDHRRSINRSRDCLGFSGYVYTLDLDQAVVV